MNKDFSKWRTWLPPFIFAVLLIIIYKTIDNFSDIRETIGDFFQTISPFLFGILIVYFLYIPCERLERVYSKLKIKIIAKRARFFSVISVYLILLLILALGIKFLFPIIIGSITDLISNIPIYYNNLLGMVNNLPEDSIWQSFNIKEALTNFSNNNMAQLLDSAKVEQYLRSIIGFTSGIFNVVISLIVSLYILLDRANIKKFFINVSDALFKAKTQIKINKYLKQINHVLFTFLASKGLDSIINAVVVSSILLILGVDYAILLGLICAIGSFIPFIGSLIAITIISIITFLTGGFNQALTALILLVIFQQIDGNIIEPKIMNTTLKISPLLVILAIVVGGAYFGIMGMFLAVPVMVIIKQILTEYISMKKTKNIIKIKTSEQEN